MSSDSDRKRKIVVGVLGLAVNREGKFLLTRRHAPGIKAWHNKWQIPGGGLEFNETPEQTLKREFKEELGVVPKVLDPRPLAKSNTWYAEESSRRHDAQVILLIYLVDIAGQPIDISGDGETNAYGWFTPAQIGKLKSLPVTVEAVREAGKILKEIENRGGIKHAK